MLIAGHSTRDVDTLGIGDRFPLFLGDRLPLFLGDRLPLFFGDRLPIFLGECPPLSWCSAPLIPFLFSNSSVSPS